MEGRWIRVSSVCASRARVCVRARVFVIFQVTWDQTGLAKKKKARGGREREKTEPLRKAAGNTETCGLSPPPHPSIPPPLSPWSSCTQMCLPGPPRILSPPHSPCAPELNATAKERESEGERECRSW